ncbi:cytochrome P450 [Amylostereum chailletii]|nr:cytochrome P450 [Amylostereum chailletii]
MENEWNLPLSHYGPRWRSVRRILEGSLRQSSISQYQPTLRSLARKFLAATIRAPGDFRTHIKYTIAAISLDVVYGYECTGLEDKFLSLSEKATAVASATVLPGAVIVNDFPFLRYLPKWFPGMGFHKLAEEGKRQFDRARNVPFDYVKKNMHPDVVRPSVVSSFLSDCRDGSASAEDEQLVNEAAGSVYGGKGLCQVVLVRELTSHAASVDTTSTVLSIFFLVLARYPEVQRKAQAELDAVVGVERHPDFSDRPNLPYIEAFCMELNRWRPAVPMGMPHCTTEDDIYDGYFIPKGVIIIAPVLVYALTVFCTPPGCSVFINVWMMLHDPGAYPDPESFIPERFLTANGLNIVPDPLCSSGFGFGRRICPGKHLADAMIWIHVASVLATLTVRPAKDHGGHDVSLNGVDFSSHIVSEPDHFGCNVSPRSRRAEDLVAASCGK